MIPQVTKELIEALRSQGQADADGTMVIVSRQAVDEAILILDSLLRDQS